MLAGVILAGGKSSRMGVDKSALILPESQISLLEHSQQQLALICAENVFISGASHPDAFLDLVPNCGPLAGIYSVLNQLQKQNSQINEIIVVAVDMPDIRYTDLDYLVKMGRESQSLCCFYKCFLPLYMPLTTEVIEYLSALFVPQTSEPALSNKQSQYALKRMVNELQGRQIAVLKDAQLDNINTPEQWQQRCAGHSLSKV